jgi:hypothetical protein
VDAFEPLVGGDRTYAELSGLVAVRLPSATFKFPAVLLHANDPPFLNVLSYLVVIIIRIATSDKNYSKTNIEPSTYPYKLNYNYKFGLRFNRMYCMRKSASKKF